jgi:uncharacterized membrane protein YphA (DoxX/SURF4 family)
MIDPRTAPYGGVLLVAAGAAWAHAGNGWVFSAQNGGWEYPIFLIAVSLVQALLGDGRYALANLPGRRNLRMIPA